MYLLFSSTSKTRYTQDALNVMAYPEGSILHLRYENAIVDPKIWDNDATWSYTQSWSSRFSPEAATLFVLVLSPVDGDGYETRRLIPLRFGRVCRMRRDGSILHVDFRLGGFAYEQRCPCVGPNLELDAAVAPKAVWRPQKAVESIWLASEHSEVVRRFVHEAKDASKWFVWEAQIRLLRKVEGFEGTLFFRVEKLRSHGVLDHRYIAPFLPEQFLNWHYNQSTVEVLKFESGYQIVRPTMHALKVVTYQGRAKSDVDAGAPEARRGEISIECDKSFFVSPATKLEVLSDYDTFFLSLFPVHSSERAITRITLSATAADSSALSPRISLPLEISHPRRTLIFAAFWIAIGLVVQVFSSSASIEVFANTATVPEAVLEILRYAGPTLATACFMMGIVVVLRRAPGASASLR